MAEKMTPNGLVVGLIIEPNAVDENPVEVSAADETETAEEKVALDKPKRGRKAKVE